MTGIPRSLVPYDPFRLINSDSIALISDLPFTNVKSSPFNAVGDGVANDTQAFINAHNALPSSGGQIIVPPPSVAYLIDPGQFVISTNNVHLSGGGFGTIIKRRTDTNGDLIKVTGTSFMASNLTIQDFSNVATNTGISLHVQNINDCELHRLWLQNGHILLNFDHGSNYGTSQCILEAARLTALLGTQASDVRVIGGAIYSYGAVAQDGQGGAGIKIIKDPAYSYNPYGWLIKTKFENGNIGHGLYAINASEIEVSSTFNYSGRFNRNVYDDIKLEGCIGVLINGSSSGNVYNGFRNGVITGATNASPIVLTLTSTAPFATNDVVDVYGVSGNTAANGRWTITVIDGTTLSLNGSAGNGAYTSGGSINERATRYNVNIDAACSNVTLGHNAFKPGISGSINNLAADTVTPVSMLTKSATVATTDATTNEITLWTFTLPANTLTDNLKGVRVKALGKFAANGNAKTLKFYFGSNAATLNITTPSPNAVNWYTEQTILRTGASAEIRGGFSTAGAVLQNTQNAALAENTANAIVIKLTGQNGVASAGDVEFDEATVEFLY